VSAVTDAVVVAPPTEEPIVPNPGLFVETPVSQMGYPPVGRVMVEVTPGVRDGPGLTPVQVFESGKVIFPDDAFANFESFVDISDDDDDDAFIPNSCLASTGSYISIFLYN
jgi:hypothetical protein